MTFILFHAGIFRPFL
jgi:hypothetical protein